MLQWTFWRNLRKRAVSLLILLMERTVRLRGKRRGGVLVGTPSDLHRKGLNRSYTFRITYSASMYSTALTASIATHS